MVGLSFRLSSLRIGIPPVLRENNFADREGADLGSMFETERPLFRIPT